MKTFVYGVEGGSHRDEPYRMEKADDIGTHSFLVDDTIGKF